MKTLGTSFTEIEMIQMVGRTEAEVTSLIETALMREEEATKLKETTSIAGKEISDETEMTIDLETETLTGTDKITTARISEGTKTIETAKIETEKTGFSRETLTDQKIQELKRRRMSHMNFQENLFQNLDRTQAGHIKLMSQSRRLLIP